jgi:hypothetical protein
MNKATELWKSIQKKLKFNENQQQSVDIGNNYQKWNVIAKIYFTYCTVKPVYNNHPRGLKNLVVALKVRLG